MITKYYEWDNITREYIAQSLIHIVNQSGYVIDIYDSHIISEDTIYDAIALSNLTKPVTRSIAISTLESIPKTSAKQNYVLAHIIEYLENGFAVGDCE